MRALPNNIEAEKSVIGAMIISAKAANHTINLLSTEDFFAPEHKIIFETIEDMMSDYQEVDIKSLSTTLVKAGKIDSAGGVEYLASIASAVVTSANIDYFIDIVLENSLARRLISVSEKIASQGYDKDNDINDLLERAERSILEIARDRRTSDFKKADSVLKDVYANIVELGKAGGQTSGVPTGFKYLDAITNGFQPGDLVILAARPSMGKTAFALNIVQQAAELSNEPVALFSLEMGAEQLMARMISAVGRIDGKVLRTGQLSNEDELRLASALKTLSANKIYIDDSPVLKVMDIASKCRNLKNEHGLSLVVIDYLQLIAGPSNSRESRQIEVSEISRSLKSLARELKVPIIALSQLSRGVEQRTDKRPLMSDLRESGAIEQDADIVAFIHRDDYYDRDNPEVAGHAELIISKHRNGATGVVNLSFEKDYNRFLTVENINVE